MTYREPIVFGGVRCAWVASHLSFFDEICWIFSICSDERLPDALELQLRHTCANEIPIRLIILGDFISIPPNRCPASFEAIRMIAKLVNYEGGIDVCWIQGESVDLTSKFAMMFIWHHISFDSLQPLVDTWQEPILQKTSEREVFRELSRLIGNTPSIRLSNDGCIVAIYLTEGQLYRRSLLPKLSAAGQEMLWSLILNLSSLREISAGFCRIKFLPDLSRLINLEILDMRGNPGIDLNELGQATSLVKLNLAACELTNVQKSIYLLGKLHTLFMHKNSINEISSVIFPPNLQRISLYRNRISVGQLVLTHCQDICSINIGANPLVSLRIGLPKTKNLITLGVRHVINPFNIINGVDWGNIILDKK